MAASPAAISSAAEPEPEFQSADETAAEAPAATAAPTAAQRRQQRLAAVPRFYVVWSLRGAGTDVRGIHGGDVAAWYQITRHIPGQRYRSGADRLRRCSSLADAVELYYQEAETHGCPLPARYFNWFPSSRD